MIRAELPTSATPWEEVLADAMPVSEAVNAAIVGMRRFKYVSPRPSMLPFLVWELGLGELTPYVPNLYQLIDQGVRWQRLRGTVSAVALGLSWIGYRASLEEEWTGRTWWNSFQLRFATLPENDVPDLERVEGIAQLSVPKRSQLRRGVVGFDVGAAEADESLLDDAFYDCESGVAITQAGTLWSFGRTHEFEHLYTRQEGERLGNWIDPTDAGLKWAELNVPWVSAHFRWSQNPATLRRSVMTNWFLDRPIFLRLRTSAGAVIGYRKCRTVRAVQLQAGGAYQFGPDRYEPARAAYALFVEARTDFEDASGIHCAEIELIVGAQVAPGVGAGRMWLLPSQLSGGAAFAAKPVSIPLRTTVREQFKFLVRF